MHPVMDTEAAGMAAAGTAAVADTEAVRKAVVAAVDTVAVLALPADSDKEHLHHPVIHCFHNLEFQTGLEFPERLLHQTDQNQNYHLNLNHPAYRGHLYRH